MLRRLYRWKSRVLLPIAALPLAQAGGCIDPAALIITTGTSFADNITRGIISSASSGILQVILTEFAGSNFLRLVLGAGS